ncbi:MAG: hypothetical protein ACREGG_03515 [Candidatus Saccharimonadales bacterium]
MSTPAPEAQMTEYWLRHEPDPTNMPIRHEASGDSLLEKLKKIGQGVMRFLNEAVEEGREK